MSRFAPITRHQFAAPPVDERERLGATRGLIGEIVGPAAVGVDGVEVADERALKALQGVETAFRPLDVQLAEVDDIALGYDPTGEEPAQ